MKKLILTAITTGLLFVTGIAQKVINEPNAQKRTASGFHAIEIGDGIDLYLSQGDEAIVVSASEVKFRDRIQTEVKNGVLKIWYDRNNNSNIRIDWGNRKMRAYVSYKMLDRVNAAGGSDVKIDGVIQANKFSLNISGGSDFFGKINATDLDIVQSGGSDTDISGKVTTLKIKAAGGSDLDGFDMVSETCTIDASGGSDVNITVNKELNVSASGGSDVHYKGSAAIVNQNKSGSSDIIKSGR